MNKMSKPNVAICLVMIIINFLKYLYKLFLRLFKSYILMVLIIKTHKNSKILFSITSNLLYHCPRIREKIM